MKKGKKKGKKKEGGHDQKDNRKKNVVEKEDDDEGDEEREEEESERRSVGELVVCDVMLDIWYPPSAVGRAPSPRSGHTGEDDVKMMSRSSHP